MKSMTRIMQVLSGIVMASIFYLAGSCSLKKSEDTSKPKGYIQGLSNQQVEFPLEAARNSMITSRAISGQAQALKSEMLTGRILTGRMLTGRMLTGRAPQVRFRVKQSDDYPGGGSQPSGEFCYCTYPSSETNGGEASLCEYTNCVDGQCENYVQSGGRYVEKFQYHYGASSVITYYIGICKDIPSEICSQEGKLIYDWRKCEFKLNGYTIVEGGNSFSCSTEYSAGATFGISLESVFDSDGDELPSAITVYIMYPSEVSKFSCAGDFYAGRVSCDIYSAKCPLGEPCSKDSYDKVKYSCSYTKISSCKGLECVEEFDKIFGDIFVEETYEESYCSYGDDEGFITMEKRGDEYIYTSSTSSEARILICSSKSKVDFGTCSMEACDKIEEEIYKLANYEESTIAIKYNIRSENSSLSVLIDKVSGDIEFSGESVISIEDIHLGTPRELVINVRGVVYSSGVIAIEFRSEEFSGSINISAEGEVSGSITVRGISLILSTTSDGRLRICDRDGNCYVEGGEAI